MNIHKLFFAHRSGFDDLPLRLTAGIIYVAHGSQKLFAWFGGHGLEGAAEGMAAIGLSPGYLMALLAGSAEFFGGLLLLAGLMTRPAALVTAFTMVVAIVFVHIDKGLFLANGGYEFGLALLGISAALAMRGGGSLSLDRLLARP